MSARFQRNPNYVQTSPWRSRVDPVTGVRSALSSVLISAVDAAKRML